jgi:hypothetical protein
MDLTKLIMNSRNIKESSANTYINNLNKINKLLGNNKLLNFDFTKQYDKIIDLINKESKTTNKKNLLTAIIVALGTYTPKETELINKYNIVLKQLNTEYFDFLKTQTRTDTQATNWITYEEITNFLNKLKIAITSQRLLIKPDLTKQEFNLLQEYIILSTYLIFPIRNNFSNMRVVTKKEYIDDIEQLQHNYLVIDGSSKYFYINIYKNVRSYGSKIFKLPVKLNKLVSKWLNHNKTGWFLIKNNKLPLNSNNITQFLNKMFYKEFKKNISSSMIRHILISHNSQFNKSIKESEDESENKYMHSSFVNQLYRKVL